MRKLGDDIETWKNDMIELLNNRASTQAKGQRYDTMLEQIQVRKAEIQSRLLTSAERGRLCTGESAVL